VRPFKAELLALIPSAPPEVDWRGDLDSWPLARHARWAAKAAGLETFDHLGRAEADRRAYDELRAEPEADERTIAGTAGGMRLCIAAPPPWPPDVMHAAALVGVIDRHHTAGDDARAAEAAERLDDVIGDLKREGVTVWLASAPANQSKRTSREH
jgi:hypothetical protein